MKIKIFSFLLALGMVFAMGCSGGAAGDAQVPSVFKVDSIVSTNGQNNVESDMVNADDGISADYVTVTVSNFLKNPGATPSHFNDVTISGYNVTFSRSDGGTVFSNFDGGLSQSVTVNSTATFNVMVVRLEEKTSGALAGTLSPYEMTAKITFSGKNGSGQFVSAVGSIEVTIANYGNDVGPLAPAIGSFFADKTEGIDGQDVALTWYVTGDVNELILNPGDIHLSPVGYYPYGTYTIHNVDFPQEFTLVAMGIFGVTSTNVSVDETAVAPVVPTINTFSAQPTTISNGQSATLSWDVSNATSVTIYPGIGTVAGTSGEMTVSPQFSTTYTLIASNGDGVKTATADLTVSNSEPQITLFTGSTDSVDANDVAHLYWTIQGNYTKAELFPYYSAVNDIINVTNQNSIVTEAIQVDTTFVLTAYGDSTIVNKTFKIKINTTTKNQVKVLDSAAVPGTLSWQVENPAVATIRYNLYTVDGDRLVFSKAAGQVEDGNGTISTDYKVLSKGCGYSVIQLVAVDKEGHAVNHYSLIQGNELCKRQSSLALDSDKPVIFRAIPGHAQASDFSINFPADMVGGTVMLKAVSGERDIQMKDAGGRWVPLYNGELIPVDSTRVNVAIRDDYRTNLSNEVALLIWGQGKDGQPTGRVVTLRLR
ncbi:MAG: hypothetical protein GXO70_10020 [Acidobacteria bacterium]|nr:hypothetical protein [Acidobacteriota bacterium]